MARSIAYLMVSFPLVLATAGTAVAQTAVETGVGAARAATTTAPAQGIGKSMSGLAGRLGKIVDSGRQASGESTAAEPSSSTTARKLPASPDVAPAAHVWEDPSGIQAGLAYPELVHRFGPPAMEITGETGKSLTYSGKAGLFQLELRDGKVTSVQKPKS